MLAWIPFLEPMSSMQTWWYLLLIPMAFGISIVYRSLREGSYTTYWHSVLLMTGQIIVGIIALAVSLGIFVQLVLPVLNSP